MTRRALNQSIKEFLATSTPATYALAAGASIKNAIRQSLVVSVGHECNSIMEELSRLHQYDLNTVKRLVNSRAKAKQSRGLDLTYEQKADMASLNRAGLSYRRIEVLANLLPRNGNNAYDAVKSVTYSRKVAKKAINISVA